MRKCCIKSSSIIIFFTISVFLLSSTTQQSNGFSFLNFSKSPWKSNSSSAKTLYSSSFIKKGRKGMEVSFHENRSMSEITVKNREMKLQRIETELHKARTFIKEALVNPKSRTDDIDDVLRGNIYRNPFAFQRSYLLMEKLFKIFVYEEGEPPIFHHGPCNNIYSTEGLFLSFMESNTLYRTTDPDEAHVYFLPFSVTMIVQHLFDPKIRDKAVLQRVVADYIRVVSHKYSYWNRSDGFDHFMLSCHDWGPRATWYVRKLFFNSIRVLCNANTSEYFSPEKDASFPEINLKSNDFTALTGGYPRNDRTFLGFFAGNPHGKIRPSLLKHWKEKDDDLKIYKTLPRNLNYSYTEMMKRSKFCICPSGFEVASPRIVEAIYAECVPVLISQYYVLPFSDVLDWDAFSVRISVGDIPKLKEILMAISEEKYAKLYEGVKQVQRHFSVNDPPKKYDVFNMIIHSVWLRRLNVKIKT